MYCSRCGTHNIEEARFCENCGNPMKPGVVPAPPVVPVAPVAPVVQPQTAYNGGVNLTDGYTEPASSGVSIVKWIVIGLIVLTVIGGIFGVVVMNKAAKEADKLMKESSQIMDEGFRQSNEMMDKAFKQSDKLMEHSDKIMEHADHRTQKLYDDAKREGERAARDIQRSMDDLNNIRW